LLAAIVGDENSAKDMGEFVRGCRKLQTETGAALLVVHHTGKAKNKKRPPLWSAGK
jgi:RecA-family ATPase